MKSIIAIITFLLLVGISIEILKFCWNVFKYLLGMAVIIGLASIAIYFNYITSKIVAVIIMLTIIVRVSKKRKVMKWYKKEISSINETDLERIFLKLIPQIQRADCNDEDYKFNISNLPYGRVNAFLNYFDTSVQSEEVYYFSPVKSMSNKEIREYGTCITCVGIYFSKQYKVKNGIEKYSVDLKVIPFKAITLAKIDSENIVIKYANIDKKTYEIIKIPIEMTTINAKQIIELNDYLIKKDIPLIYLKDKIVQSDKLDLTVVEAEKKFLSDINITNVDRVSNIAGIMATSKGMLESFNENKNYMNGERGSGYAAEYGNNTVDRVLGRKVINEAQNLDKNTGRQVKNGVDRNVNGINIQTKYYRTASESIGAAFQHNKSLYNDGGEMMQIEVPKDQYHKALELMQKRIDSGQVKGAEIGDSPEKYVKKGHFTYMQAHNIAISGTIESLSVDVLNGAVICTQVGGISAVIAFSFALWKGHSLKYAAKVGLMTGIKILGKGTLIYTLSMQLSRYKLVNPFVEKVLTEEGIIKSVAYVTNPISNVVDNLAQSLQTSAVANSEVGKIIGLDKMTGKTIVGRGVTAAVVFGPDLCRTLTGRISCKQFFKNTTVGIAGIGGSLIGQSLIPLPVVGAVVGGMVAGSVAKATLDNYIEDDAIFMFQILKEEFLDVVMMSDLTQSEFEIVVSDTIAHNKLSKMLMKMYASNDYRNYARKEIITISVTNVLADRMKITDKKIYESYNLLMNDIA